MANIRRPFSEEFWFRTHLELCPAENLFWKANRGYRRAGNAQPNFLGGRPRSMPVNGRIIRAKKQDRLARFAARPFIARRAALGRR